MYNAKIINIEDKLSITTTWPTNTMLNAKLKEKYLVLIT